MWVEACGWGFAKAERFILGLASAVAGRCEARSGWAESRGEVMEGWMEAAGAAGRRVGGARSREGGHRPDPVLRGPKSGLIFEV